MDSKATVADVIEYLEKAIEAYPRLSQDYAENGEYYEAFRCSILEEGLSEIVDEMKEELGLERSE